MEPNAGVAHLQKRWAIPGGSLEPTAVGTWTSTTSADSSTRLAARRREVAHGKEVRTA